MSPHLAHEVRALRTIVWRGQCELDVASAARSLAAGDLVAFPTETVYGLGADARSASAVRAIFAAKGRPSDNPLIVHVASLHSLTRFGFAGRLPLPAQKLARTFWPGPLTLVLPLASADALAPGVTAGLSTVGVRVPRHPVAAALLAAADVPVAAPSANRSGRPSPTSAAHVLADLDGRVAGLLDAGESAPIAVGLESTVVDATREDRLTVLRPGAVSRRQLEDAAGVPVVEGSGRVSVRQTPPAPGMKYRHYAPVAPLRVVPRGEVRREVDLECSRGSVGVLADSALCAELQGEPGVVVVPCGVRGDPSSSARELYAALRAFDGEGVAAGMQSEPVRVIIAAALDESDDGIAAAFMNRLRKAASGGDLPAS